MLVSEKTEISICQDVAKQAEQEYGGVCTDEKLNARVESVGKKLVAVCDRKKIPYTFKILNTKELNAFACPGGPVYITRALLDKLKTDDELAFVLGHEVGHVSKQHSRKAINKALMANMLATALFSNKDKVVQQGAGIAWTIIDRGHSREQEYEADKCGATYAMKAGFKGAGAVDALTVIQKEAGGEGKQSGLNKLLSTHPPTPDRINRVKGLLNSQNA
jgi:predicted Zn-dependent protease